MQPASTFTRLSALKASRAAAQNNARYSARKIVVVIAASCLAWLLVLRLSSFMTGAVPARDDDDDVPVASDFDVLSSDYLPPTPEPIEASSTGSDWEGVRLLSSVWEADGPVIDAEPASAVKVRCAVLPSFSFMSVLTAPKTPPQID